MSNQAKHEWIPVSDWLPKENKHVLVVWRHFPKAVGQIGIGCITNHIEPCLWHVNNKWQDRDKFVVTHWMPLPEPPND